MHMAARWRRLSFRWLPLMTIISFNRFERVRFTMCLFSVSSVISLQQRALFSSQLLLSVFVTLPFSKPNQTDFTYWHKIDVTYHIFLVLKPTFFPVRLFCGFFCQTPTPPTLWITWTQVFVCVILFQILDIVSNLESLKAHSLCQCYCINTLTQT